MYLKKVQGQPVEGMMRVAFKKLQEAGSAVPEIMHLFRFKKPSTDHLVRFTEQVMRGPSPLSRGLRELIGAYLSSRNQCGFCQCAHAPVAAQLLGAELVEEVLRDPDTSRLDAAHKELFRYISKLAENPALVTAADIDRLKLVGWSDEAIYDALTVASMFKFYNTWNNGAGVRPMSSADYAHSGERLISLGYCMDFSFLGSLKVLWAGRKEVRFTDFLELVKSWLGLGSNQLPATLTTAGPETKGAQPPADKGRACQLNGRARSLRPQPARAGRKVRMAATT